MTEISRRGLIRASLGAGIGLPTLSALAAQPAMAEDSGTPQLDDLGPASEVTSTSVAHQVGDHIWTATSGVSPVQVGAYNVTTHKIDRLIPLPSGAGTWAMASIGTDLYVGTYTPGDLYRIDTTAGTATKVANFGQFIWCLDATPDGRIVAGTYPDAGVFEYDPVSGETKAFGTAVDGEQYVRGIAANETTIYAGVGAHAHLIAVDRATGTKQEMLPAAYLNRTFVATMTLAGDRLVVGLSATATMLIFDLAGTSAPVEVQAPAGEQYIVAITVDESDDSIYFGCRPSGTLYRYDSASGELSALGQPYDGAYFNRIFLADGLIRAELTSEVVEYDPASGEFTGYGLVEAGLPPAPELAMQMAATRNHVLVSGKAGIQIHDLTSGTSSRTFLTGEAKTITPVGNSVYLGVYTLARLFKMRSDGSQLAQFGSVEHEQTRPSGAVYDESANRLLMTTEAEYGHLNGALVVYDIDADRIDVHPGVVPDQGIASLAKLGDVAYLGSNIRNLGAEPVVDTATVSAFDLSTTSVRWQVTPVAGAGRITSLVPYRGRIYGTANNGKLVEMNPSNGDVLATVSVAAGMSTLVATRSQLYGTDGKRVFSVTTSANQPPQVRTVVSGLGAQTYSFPMIAVSHDGSALYTMKAKNLVRLSLR